MLGSEEREPKYKKYTSRDGIDLNYCLGWQLLEVCVRYTWRVYHTHTGTSVPVIPLPDYVHKLLKIKTLIDLEEEASRNEDDKEDVVAAGILFSDDMGNYFRVESIHGESVYVRDATNKGRPLEIMDYEAVQMMIASTFND